MNNWSTKSALTNKELDIMTQISSLFNQANKQNINHSQNINSEKQSHNDFRDQKQNNHKIDQNKLPVNKQGNDANKPLQFSETLNQSQQLLQNQDKLATETLTLISKIESNKGQVLANTRDFQLSCMSILKRERMLTKVVREIEKNMQCYKDYEECTRILQYAHQQLLDQPRELIQVLRKIEKGLDFFKQNWQFKKADVFQRRFESLRETALEKVNLKILKIMRDANAENNLKVVSTQIFEKATKFEDLDVKNIIYCESKQQPISSQNQFQNLHQEVLPSFDILKLLITSVEESASIHKQNFEFCEKIYEEYFDHRLYLIEQYSDCVGRIIVETIPIKSLFQYMVKFMELFTNLFQMEQEYFMRQFSNKERFNQFRKENEYDLINKKLRPYIIYSNDVINLCDAIDLLQDPLIANKIHIDTNLRLFSDLQERLLLISHYSLNETFQQQNISVLLQKFKQNQGTLIVKEDIPFTFIQKLLEILHKLQSRIKPDIYRGLLLETMQRIYSEFIERILNYESTNKQEVMEVLLLAHANIIFIMKELQILGISFDELQRNRSSPNARLQNSQDRLSNPNSQEIINSQLQEIQSTTPDTPQEDTEIMDDEIDLDKTKQNLWQLLTFTTNTQQYESLFHFIDDSIPTLKKKQQKDMLEQLQQRLYLIQQRISKCFIKDTFSSIDVLHQKLKSDKEGPKSMTDYEKQLIFTMKYDGVDDEKVQQKYSAFLTENIRELYLQCLSSLAEKYQNFSSKTALIIECLSTTNIASTPKKQQELQNSHSPLREIEELSSSPNHQTNLNGQLTEIYNQIQSELRLKSLNHLQKFYTILSNHYNKGRYEEIRLKSFQEVNQEVFGELASQL
eukprot:403366099